MKKKPLFVAVSCVAIVVAMQFFYANHYSQKHLSKLVEEKQWEALSSTVVHLSEHDKTLQNLEFLTTRYPNSAFSHAYNGSKKILAMDGTGLSFSTIFPILLFYHTTFPNEIQQKVYFWPESRFGRELQYDPETKSFFIHLGVKAIPPLGVGVKKVVSKTILYGDREPKIFARGCSTAGTENEIIAMHALNNKHGVISFVAEMSHTDPKSDDTIYTVVTPLYNEGSLESVMNKRALTFEQKLDIACDISAGLAAVHKEGFVHRDLGARNYFVNIDKESKHVEAVVADLGRTIPMSKAKCVPVQGNKSYISPEGFFREKMEGEMYQKSDVFALGTVLYSLYFEKKSPWKERFVYRKHGLTLQEKIILMEYWMGVGREELVSILSKDDLDIRKKTFIKVIYEMTKAAPERMSAQEASEILGSLRSLH